MVAKAEVVLFNDMTLESTVMALRDSPTPSSAVIGGIPAAKNEPKVSKPDIIVPIGDMLDHVMKSRTTRVAVIAAWWWFGWHFAFADTVQLNL